MNERRGNVYENKGPLWKTWRRSWNVIENKGTYGFNPAMSLKTHRLFGEIAGSSWGLSLEQCAYAVLVISEQALRALLGMELLDNVGSRSSLSEKEALA